MNETTTKMRRIATIVPGTEGGQLELRRIALEEVNKWLGENPGKAINSTYIRCKDRWIILLFEGACAFMMIVYPTAPGVSYSANLYISIEPIEETQGMKASIGELSEHCASLRKTRSLADAPLLSEVKKPQVIADFGKTRLVVACDDDSDPFSDGPAKNPCYVIERMETITDALGEKHVWWITVRTLQGNDTSLIEDLIKWSRRGSFDDGEEANS